MVQSNRLRFDWLPAVALCTALAAAMLAWNPPVGDLAAQVFRTELFQRGGLSIWNGSWYGGHYTLTYSVLFPPLAALLGPRIVGGLAVIASAYLFDRLVRERWGEAARWATLWFAAGVVTLLADGQLTFALGVACGLASLRALQLGWRAAAIVAAAACALSSPVAAVFLAGALLVGAVPGERLRAPAAWAASIALALLMLLWSPPVGDLAAQAFRAELFERAGLAIWNSSWYGGHYTLTYSVLFPPLAALLGPQVVGMLAVVVSSYFFDRLVRDRWGVEARWATLWFAAGVVTLLADGQLTFALGVAFGLAALRCLQTGRAALAILAAAACPLASPVAGAFLAGVLLAGAAEPGRRPSRLALAAGGVSLALVLVPNLAFPETGEFPFVFSSYVAIPLWCAGALILTHGVREEERQLRRVLVAYLLAATVIWLLPNAMGGNAVRLGALFGGPVMLCALWGSPLWRRLWIAPLLVAGFASLALWMWSPAVRDVIKYI
ncbi:MAG TPA: hypothetical protein VHF50_00300, partial [Solirubrobacterales bacterium]|nr:hypothetical protein [Solirubrobacterales bacterium]